MFSAEVYPTIRPLSRISVNCCLIADALIEFLESLHLVYYGVLGNYPIMSAKIEASQKYKG
jgi:hypothetical protein